MGTGIRKKGEWVSGFETAAALTEHQEEIHGQKPETVLKSLEAAPIDEEYTTLRLRRGTSLQTKHCCYALLHEKKLSLPEKAVKLLLSHTLAQLPLFLRLAVGALAIDTRVVVCTSDVTSAATLNQSEVVQVCL